MCAIILSIRQKKYSNISESCDEATEMKEIMLKQLELELYYYTQCSAAG